MMKNTSTILWNIQYSQRNAYCKLHGQMINLTQQQIKEIKIMNGNDKIGYNQWLDKFIVKDQKVKDHITKLLEVQMQTILSKQKPNFSMDGQWVITGSNLKKQYSLKDANKSIILQLTSQWLEQIGKKYEEINNRYMSSSSNGQYKIYKIKDNNTKLYIVSKLQNWLKIYYKNMLRNQQSNTQNIEMQKVQNAKSISANNDIEIWTIQRYYQQYALISAKGVSYKLTNEQLQQIEQQYREQCKKQLHFQFDICGNRFVHIAKIYDHPTQTIASIIKSLQRQTQKQSQMKVKEQQFCENSEQNKESYAISDQIYQKSNSDKVQLQLTKIQYQHQKQQIHTEQIKLQQQLQIQKQKVQNQEKEENKLLNTKQSQKYKQQTQNMRNKCSNLKTTIQEIKTALGLEDSNDIINAIEELKRESNTLKNFCQFERDCQKQIKQNIQNYDPKQSQTIGQNSVYRAFIEVVQLYRVYNNNTHQQCQSQIKNMQESTKLQIKQTKEQMEMKQAQLKRQINEQHSKYRKLFNYSQQRIQSQRNRIDELQKANEQLKKLKDETSQKQNDYKKNMKLQ